MADTLALQEGKTALLVWENIAPNNDGELLVKPGQLLVQMPNERLVMLISNAHKFIFIETPKTASSSMRSLLVQHEDEEHNFPKHAPARAAIRKMGEQRWESYHSFAVMREPIDWLHSWYKFWRGGVREGKFTAEHAVVLNMGFEDFLHNAALNHAEEPFRRIGLQTNKFYDVGKTKCLVNRLICFENLHLEWCSLKKDLHLEALAELPRRNVSGEQLERPELSNETLRIVCKRWRKDFEVYAELSNRRT